MIAALLLGILSPGPSFAASKPKRDLEAELDQVKDENSKLRQQVDDLNAKIDLLMTRIDQLEKKIAGLSSSSPQASQSKEKIEESEIVIEAHGSTVEHKGSTPDFPVIKIQPDEEPPPVAAPKSQPQAKKVIIIEDDQKNPNNPKIKVEKAPPKSASGKQASGNTKKVITFNEKDNPNGQPTITEEAQAAPPKTKPAEAKAEPGKTEEVKSASLDDIKQLIDKKQYAEAEKEIKARLANKPKEKEACPLYAYLGDTRAKEGKAADAAAAYLKVADLYPACDLAPGSMFKAGELYEKIDKNKSLKIYGDIVSLYPYSNYANLAEEKFKK
jgi:TolA-binding protein